jgi:hypothetical protein
MVQKNYTTNIRGSFFLSRIISISLEELCEFEEEKEAKIQFKYE